MRTVEITRRAALVAGTVTVSLLGLAGVAAADSDLWTVTILEDHSTPAAAKTAPKAPAPAPTRTRVTHPTRVLHPTVAGTAQTVVVPGAARTITGAPVTTTPDPTTITAPATTVTLPPTTLTAPAVTVTAAVTVTIPGPPPVTVTPTGTTTPTVAGWWVTWPDGTRQWVQLTHP